MKLIVKSIMKTILLIQFVLIFGLSFSQEHFFGFDVGGSITSVERVNYGYYSSSYGLNFNANYTFKKGLFISKLRWDIKTKALDKKSFM